MKIRTMALAGLSAACITGAHAQTAFATDTNEDLYVIDISTGTASFVGHHGYFLESLAYDPVSNRLFGHDDFSSLVELSTVDGSVLQTWNTGLGNVEGMDFSEPGNLWMTDFSSQTQMHRWNVSLEAFDDTADTQVTTGLVRTMAFSSSPVRAMMYGDQPTYQTLYSFDGLSPATALGDNGGMPIYAMDNFGGVFYGLSESGEIFRINQLDGSVSLVNDTGDHFWLGMSTLNPVPEPATLSALALGAVALLRKRRK